MNSGNETVKRTNNQSSPSQVSILPDIYLDQIDQVSPITIQKTVQDEVDDRTSNRTTAKYPVAKRDGISCDNYECKKSSIKNSLFINIPSKIITELFVTMAGVAVTVLSGGIILPIISACVTFIACVLLVKNLRTAFFLAKEAFELSEKQADLIKNLQSDIEDSRQTIETLKETNEELTVNVDNLAQENSQLLVRGEEMGSVIKEQNTELQSVRETIQQIARGLQKSTNEIVPQIQEIHSIFEENCQKIAVSLGEINNDISGEITNLQNEIAEKCKNLEEICSKQNDSLNRALEQQGGDASVSLSALTESIKENFNANVQVMQGLVSLNTDVQSRLSIIKEKVNTELQRVAQKLTDMTNQAQEMSNKCDSLREEITQIQTKISSVQAESEEAQKQNVLLQVKQAEMQQLLQSQQEECSKVQENIDRLTDIQKELATQNDQLRQDARVLEENNDLLASKLQSAASQLQNQTILSAIGALGGEKLGEEIGVPGIGAAVGVAVVNDLATTCSQLGTLIRYGIFKLTGR